MMPSIYELHKPLRNHLKKVNLLESLYVIWAYEKHLKFGKSFPRDIEVDSGFLNASHWVNKGVFPWELETIAKEIIINSIDPYLIDPPKTLRRWPCFRSAINKLKFFENNIVKFHPVNSELLEMFRIIHREFPWQINNNSIWLYRYYKIFSHEKIDEIIQKVIGINAKELYTIGFALVAECLIHFRKDLPLNIKIRGLDEYIVNQFLSHFSKDLESIKNDLISLRKYDENYIYTYNPLISHPLIKVKYRHQDALISPMPTLLFRRFTQGLYYEICNESNFGKPFGESFQNYVGEVLEKVFVNHNYEIYPEREYYIGKERKDSIDWIVCNDDSALFIEVKAKKLRLEAKIEINDIDVLHEDLDKMAESIIQSYKTIGDYIENHYPHLKYNKERKIYPILLTLESWDIWVNQIRDMLLDKIHEKFELSNINICWLDEMPYTICDVEEFESLIQVINCYGINKVMGEKVFDSEKRNWPIKSFLNDFTNDELIIENLFPEAFEKIFPDIIKHKADDK
ncbi:hypothetical protein ACFL6H_06095 [Candidatus Latescibacterota bacterium]